MERQAQPAAPLLSWMESLADPTRVRLLRLLERDELGVSDLMDALRLPQSTVSRHLKTLLDHGFVTSRGRGSANLYAMRNGELPPPARRLWQLVREQTEGWATLRQDRLRLERRLRERPDDAQAFFARSAGEWDKLRRELYGAAFGDAALRGLLPRDWVVADLACGTGSVAAALAPHVARVVGIDNSPAMLKAAARRVAGHPNVELKRGDLEALPLAGGACDAALLVLALTYAEDPGRVLAEAARILRPGGRLVAVDLLRHDRDDFRRSLGQRHAGFEPQALDELLRAAGLAPDHCAPLPPEPEAKGPALVLASAARATTFSAEPDPAVARPAARGPERNTR